MFYEWYYIYSGIIYYIYSGIILYSGEWIILLTYTLISLTRFFIRIFMESYKCKSKIYQQDNDLNFNEILGRHYKNFFF